MLGGPGTCGRLSKPLLGRRREQPYTLTSIPTHKHGWAALLPQGEMKRRMVEDADGDDGSRETTAVVFYFYMPVKSSLVIIYLF